MTTTLTKTLEVSLQLEDTPRPSTSVSFQLNDICQSAPEVSLQLEDTSHDSLIFDYLLQRSCQPGIYEAWAAMNWAYFDGSLRPIPIVVGLSQYGKHNGHIMGGTDHILIQHGLYYGDTAGRKDWRKTLLHEMLHQADHQEGIEYETYSRLPDIHNTPQWAARVNWIMEKLGEKRFATPFKKTNSNEVLPRYEAPEGYTTLTRDELRCWGPLELPDVFTAPNARVAV